MARSHPTGCRSSNEIWLEINHRAAYTPVGPRGFRQKPTVCCCCVGVRNRLDIRESSGVVTASATLIHVYIYIYIHIVYYISSIRVHLYTYYNYVSDWMYECLQMYGYDDPISPVAPSSPTPYGSGCTNGCVYGMVTCLCVERRGRRYYEAEGER